MDVASLDTADESAKFLTLCHQKQQLFEQVTYIGGLANGGFGANGWFWWNSGKFISYPLTWDEDEPNFAESKEYCLSITKYGFTGFFKFNDMSCEGNELKFVCQQSKDSSSKAPEKLQKREKPPTSARKGKRHQIFAEVESQKSKTENDSARIVNSINLTFQQM